MGNSASAILCYGVNFGEDISPICDPDKWEGFDEYLAIGAGLKDADYREKIDLEESCPIELVYHGYHEYPEFILAVKKSIIRAEWGDPEHLDKYIAPGEWSKCIREFCKSFNIELPHEPTILLCSRYG
jgi:hypothetical protein